MLPAHDGAISIEGVAFSFALLSNYMATGEIRSRGSMSPDISVYLRPARQGSFLQDLVLRVANEESLFISRVIGKFAPATTTKVITAIATRVLSEVTGQPHAATEAEARWLKKLPSGDMEALIDKVEPSIRRAHTVIGEGAGELIITKSKTPLISFNADTKAWVNTNIQSDGTIERVVNIPAFNANTGNGRAYIAEVGKTVPFSVIREPAQRTYETLGWSLREYARERPSNIKIICSHITSLDDKIKKLVIEGASRLP
jgi:hypothetical protein